MTSPQISIVVPLFNEADPFPVLIQRLNKLMDHLPLKIEVILVDDGSQDATPRLMTETALNDERYQCIFLSRNYGHQIAVTAGLKATTASEAIMIIDGDLQDPPELLIKFYRYYKKGYDVIYGVRRRRHENYFKRISYHYFYRILRSISYISIPSDSGDFSLISRRVVDILNKMPEESRYLRGMRAWIGLKQIGAKYDRDERNSGRSKYTLKKLFKLAYDGIFNFSEIPIKTVGKLGFLTVFASLIYFAQTVFKKVVYNTVPAGFTALLFVIILFGGIQLISIGVVGEYVLRIFFQVKGRPLYIVEKRIINKKIMSDLDN